MYKVNGASTEFINTYAFETENQINKIVDELSKDPDANIGKNPGTLLFKETIPYFEANENPKPNVSKKTNINPFKSLSKDIKFDWKYKRPFR